MFASFSYSGYEISLFKLRQNYRYLVLLILFSGKSKWFYLLSLSDRGAILACKLGEVPFESVLQMQFSYSEKLLLLGSDKILYGLEYEGKTGHLRAIFNRNQQHVRKM